MILINTEMDTELFPAQSCNPLDLTMTTVTAPTSATTTTTTMPTEKRQMSLIKQERLETEMATKTLTGGNGQTHTCYVKQPTIILATTTQLVEQQFKQEKHTIPKVNIKVEPPDAMDIESTSYDSIHLPPTPPSSASSDSEGGLSPRRSPPSSPQRMLQPRSQMRQPMPSPFIQSTIPQSGVLILTEEEKRTLISEGYPIPSKLPLTKQEEKNLKKIRRKIKNKISAQESRRKKKEYLECLEKRVEQVNVENNDLRKKVDSLESSNRSLLSQLQKLQNICNKVCPSSPTTQAGTCLMVLVLFFSVFLGNMSPTSLNIGYSPIAAMPKPDFHFHDSVVGPHPKDAYATPNQRSSRVLLSMQEEHDVESAAHDPNSLLASIANKFFHEVTPDEHDNTAVVFNAVSPQSNDTADEVKVVDQASMHPDIAADIRVMDQSVNATA
ncbi:cyclic AMP-responsive element-binding protein 3-like protein 1 isoform X2 [Lingula anatina]|uniref:Cyclic AMP-responsive element-binding protein 3-like protein 1 isoform X2 n=1 Tax=Lingula anatina TaxID=7574 RepID=A0A1S3HTC4_LINAN|nr:cyclic AMP-responsive element-binding protein 3-like protein 1 isoform X2 [Lingula anatina]|eukprot:XP_013388801.1 cyclic AMP-responsive element-binding protein 3-like protein 1 isoform X2 [Lingula anatina]